jgi:VWFA-related protein
LIDALVTETDRQVKGLSAQDFIVRDNGVVQEIQIVESGALPLNIFLGIDTGSDSISDAMPRFARSLSSVLGGLHPKDRVSVVTFGSRPRLVVPLTDNREAVLRGLGVGAAERHSALTDALYALTLLSRDEPGRAIAIVFTQGTDSASWAEAADVVAAARRSNALVYGVTLRRRIDTSAPGFTVRRDADGDLRRRDFARPVSGAVGIGDVGVLQAVSQVTGGRVVYGDASEILDQALSDILAEFRSRYVLAYRPSHPKPGWHDVAVSLRGKRGTVTARKGYIMH